MSTLIFNKSTEQEERNRRLYNLMKRKPRMDIFKKEKIAKASDWWLQVTHYGTQLAGIAVDAETNTPT
jgi:hypothetical protein